MARFITDRKEIAQLINIEKIPVIVMNIEKKMDGYDRCYEGDKVVIKDIRCQAMMYGDGKNEGIDPPFLYKEISLMPEPLCIHSSFGYRDVQEMVEWRKAIQLKENSEVLVLFESKDFGFLKKMKVGKATDWVYPTANLVDLEG